MAEIITLKDKENNIQYPQTHTDAVLDSNGNTLTELVTNINSLISELSGYQSRFRAIEDNIQDLIDRVVVIENGGNDESPQGE